MLPAIHVSLLAMAPVALSPMLPIAPPAVLSHAAETPTGNRENMAFLFKGRKKTTVLIEVPQQVQYDGLYAPEVGRIRPGDRRPGLVFKPEMDNDPREPWLEPAEPTIIEIQDNRFMNSRDPM